jgi:hypothetical protein
MYQWTSLRSAWVGCLLTLFAGAIAAQSEVSPEGPGFATCASYYFLAARGHGVRDYDRLYTSGEHSLNLAATRHGQDAATQKMEAASNTMMTEMRQDWREIGRLDARYADACDTLLRDAGFQYE